MQPYPRAPDLVWPGQLHGTGSLSARASDTGFPTVVWCLCLGLGCGWVWVSVTLPVLAGVLGGCVGVRFVVSSVFWRLGFVAFVVGLGFRPAPYLSWSGIWDARGCVRAPPTPRRFRFRCAVWACVLGSGFGLRPATPWGVLGCVCARAPVPRGFLPLLGEGAVRGCVFVRAPCLFPAFPGWGLLCGRACWARVSVVPRSSWLGCRGVFFFLRVLLWLCGVGRWMSLFVALWSLSPHPLSFGLGCWLFFFSRPSVVCVCAFWVSLPPLGRCSWFGVAGFGWVVPLCSFGGPVFGAFRVGDLAAPCGVGGRFGGCGPFSRPPPPPPLFFLGGGGLPVPPSAFPGLAHALARILCGLPGCCWRLRSAWPRPGPMGRVGYVHVGLGAPSCRVRSWLCRLGGFVWLWVRGLGLSVSFLLRGAGFNLLGGPPPLLPGARWPRVWPAVPVCGVLVRRLLGCAVAFLG